MFEDVAVEPRQWRPLSLPIRSWDDFAGSVRVRDFRKARHSRMLSPNLVASRGHRWEGLTAGAHRRCRSRARRKSLRGMAPHCLGRYGLGKFSLAAYARAIFERRHLRMLPPNLVAWRGHRWEGLGAGAQRRCRLRARRKSLRGMAPRCLGRYGLGKISLAAHARAILERPSIRGRCR